jgi:hypothetical protein
MTNEEDQIKEDFIDYGIWQFIEGVKSSNELKDFEKMKALAEMRALSKLSLEQPLTDEQLNKFLALKKELLL